MSDLSENPFEQHSAVTSSQTPPESSSPDTAGRAYTSSSAAPPAATPQLTRTPSPAPVQQPSPQQERETVNDPGIIALRGMFPDYDDLILQSVLQSVDGNQERAIDALLGMSDPDYRSEAPPTPAAPQPVALSQEELDEQFARQLVLQEQQQQTEQWLQAAGGGRTQPVVYQPRNARSGWTPQPSADQAQERPSEFQEQFSKLAETGKKTFGNIFSKVKAKIQELDQGRQASGSSEAQQQQQNWAPPPSRSGTGGYSGGYTPSPQPLPQQQQAAYYDPNPLQGSVYSSRATDVQGYDVSSSEASLSPAPASAATAQQLQRQPSPQPVTVPPPQISTTLDGGKLGLLPKRPVTLLRNPSTPTSATGNAESSATRPRYHDDESDDGLEYAENPFDSEPSTGKK